MSYKIYVGQLSDQTTEESLRHVFGEFGEVKHVELRTGFAFVTFESEDDMQRAIDDMNDKELDGSRIRVERERGTTEGGFRGTDGRIKPPRRLDLRVLIRGLHPKVDWKDLKDWARDTVGEVTYSNVFVRDGQHMGLIEMKVGNILASLFYDLFLCFFFSSYPRRQYESNSCYRMSLASLTINGFHGDMGC